MDDLEAPYFGGAGVNPSRLRPGSGFGFGLGAFLTSFLPLSLLPMGPSVTHEGGLGEGRKPAAHLSMKQPAVAGRAPPLRATVMLARASNKKSGAAQESCPRLRTYAHVYRHSPGSCGY